MPHGLMFTSILSPFLYIWLLLKRRHFVLETFFAFLFPFLFMNVVDGIIWKDFIVTATLLLTVYVSAYAMGVAIQELRHLDYLIHALIWINLAIALVGLIVRFTPFALLMWQNPAISGSHLERFQGFDSEPDGFVYMMMPLVVYAYWRLVRWHTRGDILRGIAVLIPLLMALAYGPIACLVVSVAVTHLIRSSGWRRFGTPAGIGLAILTIFFALPSHSRIRERVTHILSGTDQSTHERTAEAYLAGYAMARHKDLWFGVGLGEAKEATGRQITSWNGIGKGSVPAAIPHQLGEMGIVGLLLRFALELFFFVKTRPDRSAFRLTLFVWMFLIQFAGSHITNISEYVIWILAFSPQLDTLVDGISERFTESVALDAEPQLA